MSDDLSQRALRDLLTLDGRVAVVTGGSSGIGEAIVRRLRETGATVVIGDLHGGDDSIAADVADPQAVERLADSAVASHGRIDIWVNNAGIYPFSPIRDADEAHWRAVMSVDLDGAFYGARAAARRMKGGGVIVNISSVSGHRGAAWASAYVAAKHGVEGLTKSLAAELGPEGIRVVSVAPGLTVTPGTDASLPTREASGFGNDTYAGLVPLRRVGVPDDVARVVAFAASDLAGFVTGAVIPVEGGMLAI